MPRRRGVLLRVLLNPLVVVAVVVAVITAGWVLYTDGTGSVAQSRPGGNLFPAIDPSAEPTTSASGDPTAPEDGVGGWTVDHSGDSRASLALVDGQVSDTALQLDVTAYGSGDVTLTSPRVEVEPDTTYLFKAFTTSAADFTLLVRVHHADGRTTLEELPSAIERPGDAPFTVSDAFRGAETTTAVEYVFRLTSKAGLRVEGAYLEAAEDVLVPPAATTEPNLIPDPRFTDVRLTDAQVPGAEITGAEPAQPHAWTPYASGRLRAESGRSTDDDGSFLWTRITDYQDGEAKWQYEPVPVSVDRAFEFGATYRSEREVDVVAEFELADGGRSFLNLTTVQPAGEWTTISTRFQVPAGATTVMVTLVSHGDGTTGVRDYSLVDVTAPGPLRWDEPMVSITFDDGWQSVYDRALPLLDQHGFRSTQYVNPSSLETPNFMTGAEVRELHEAGHEIASHSYEHVDLTSIGADRLDEEMRRSKEVLTSAGLGTDDLAVPYGRSDPQVDWYATRYFGLVRGTDDGINTAQNLEPHNLKVFYVTDETTTAELNEALAATSRVNGWLILVYHQIATPDATGIEENTIASDRSPITSDVFAEQLQLIDDSGIEVQPVARAFDLLQTP
ncbi:hypothetical protein E8P82_04410 [Arthrobacter echini]|uniref:NodB homology domain-containing protein n=1 Tax=Arthrobacter echini TaxID=1529066 RepID=A0A4S5E6V4_9MICC|nr:polysaccharide deacetylase family protein [Arthrobacter echini]THJ67356.1 hypothetical protein E8P82_04410 [Arthrobacter echini]